MGSRNKVKVFVFGSDNIGWSIDRDREAVIEFLNMNGFEITNNIFSATHIFCVWYDLLLHPKQVWLRLVKRFSQKYLITVVTNDVSFTPEKLAPLKSLVDLYIVPSQRLYRFLQDKHLNVYRIPFFVNPNTFYRSSLSKKEICAKLNIDWELMRDKTIIGSFQRDSMRVNLRKPKWHKNPDLLIQILKSLPKEQFLLLLAGPRRHYVIEQCKKENIHFLFYGDYSYIQKNRDDNRVNTLSPHTINDLYNLADLYLVTSKSEGGPKQILESALTQTLVFSTSVGLAPDILHSSLLFEDQDMNVVVEKVKTFFEYPKNFQEYIQYNFQKARSEMDRNVLKEKYKQAILSNQ